MTPLALRALRRTSLALAAIPLVAAGCGGSEDTGPALEPEAAAGMAVAEDRGCTSCHGADGEGTIGPAWVGLLGSERTFQDGTTGVADEAYLRESIADPDAKRVEGFALFMPPNTLTDAEITQVIAYIETLK